MKRGPSREVWFRHLPSEYNLRKVTKAADPEYGEFKAGYKADIERYRAGLTPPGQSVISPETCRKATAQELALA